MTIIKTEMKLCTCCMEEHEVETVQIMEHNEFKGVPVEYPATYEYCKAADEFHETEELSEENDISFKNAYRMKCGLLTSDEIQLIRQKYQISQADLATLLGWGAKTITRYESHQVQDTAHDAILRKIDQDPEWYLMLLKKAEDKFSRDKFSKYQDICINLYEENQDAYLRKTILAKYIKFDGDNDTCGNTRLNLSKVVDVVRYFSNSPKVTNLFKVKLMKLLWYSDMLSFRRQDHSITGLAYCAKPMGALPVAHDLLLELRGIRYEEVPSVDHVGYRLLESMPLQYPALSIKERQICDQVIEIFGNRSTNDIVNIMHGEDAYTHTEQGKIISYQYAETLSIR